MSKLTNVVGVVENLEAMRTVQTRHGSRDLMCFNISDGRHCLSVYSPFPEHYEVLYETQLENPVIVILTSTRVSVFRNTYVIGNLPSTKIYINFDDPQVFLMQHRPYLVSTTYKLTSYRTTWKIKARVTRMWPSVSIVDNGIETMKGYNLILLDDDDCHVHVFVYADNRKYHADKIVEGGVFVFSNFYTKEALGSLRPVSSKFCINFSPSTNVERVEDDFMIAMHKFEFVDLSDLFAVVNAYEKTVLPIIQQDICKFRITDRRDAHKDTVWGNLAVTTDARVKEVKAGFKDGEEEPIIVIVSSTKLKIWKSSVQISTLLALREEGYVPFDKTTSSPTTTYVKEVVSVIETVTLKELSEKTSTDFLKAWCKYASYFLARWLHYSKYKQKAAGPLPDPPHEALDKSFRLNQALLIRKDVSPNGARPNQQCSFHCDSIKVTDVHILKSMSLQMIDGKLRATLNRISFINPDVPIWLADKYNVKEAYKLDFPKVMMHTPHKGND
ncbi:hypothetical protein AgCh_001177 [Apium graveolens]